MHALAIKWHIIDESLGALIMMKHEPIVSYFRNLPYNGINNTLLTLEKSFYSLDNGMYSKTLPIMAGSTVPTLSNSYIARIKYTKILFIMVGSTIRLMGYSYDAKKSHTCWDIRQRLEVKVPYTGTYPILPTTTENSNIPYISTNSEILPTFPILAQTLRYFR